MSLHSTLIFGAAALASLSAIAHGQSAAQKDGAATQTPPPEANALAESCSARKFETTVDAIVDGKLRSSKVKLCGKEGQTDADWANTLKDAAKKVESNATMAPATKDQIITAFNAEIARTEAPNHVANATPGVTAPPSASPEAKPLQSISAVAIQPPLQAPATVARKPRLTIRCSTPGERGAASACISLERDTLLTITADEELTGGASLRFLRRGEARGEIAVAQMRQGQSLRSKLPPQLCSGVVSSKVEIQILGRVLSGTGSAQALETLGPYSLRC